MDRSIPLVAHDVFHCEQRMTDVEYQLYFIDIDTAAPT